MAVRLVHSFSAVTENAPLDRVHQKVYRTALGDPLSSPLPTPAYSLAWDGARWAGAAVRALTGSASPVSPLPAVQQLVGASSSSSRDPLYLWDRYVRWMTDEGYPELSGRTLLQASVEEDSPSDILRMLLHHGPVLMFTQWPGHFNDRSKDWGALWVGSDGFTLTGPFESVAWRAVLIRGVAYRYRRQPSVYVSDQNHGDAWMPFTAITALWTRSARFLAVV